MNVNVNVELLKRYARIAIVELQLYEEERKLIALAKENAVGPPDFVKACDLLDKLPKDYPNRRKHAYLLTQIEPCWMLPENRVFEL